MLSEGGEENSIYHAFAAPFIIIIRHSGTERGTNSIIKSGQKDTEASITLGLGRLLMSRVAQPHQKFQECPSPQG